MAALSRGILPLMILLLVCGAVPAYAATYDGDIDFYGNHSAGYLTFTSDFTSTGGGWGANYIYFNQFNMGGDAFSVVGFGVDSGATGIVQEVSTREIRVIVTNTALSGNLYVYDPMNADPSEVVGASSWGKSGGLITVAVPSGTTTIAIKYSNTVPGASIPKWVLPPLIQGYLDSYGLYAAVLIVIIIIYFSYRKKPDPWRDALKGAKFTDDKLRKGYRKMKKDVWED